MLLKELLYVIEFDTKIILRESSTELWTEHNNKTILNGKYLCEVLHNEIIFYMDYKVIGVEIEEGKLYIAIYNVKN